MKVLVVGAGAIGGYFGTILARGGHDVTMLVRAAYADRVRANGFRIVDGPDEGVAKVTVIADLSEAMVPDLVLFAVKTYHTDELAKSLAPVVGPSTVVLPLQNGADRAAAIQRHVAKDAVLAGTVFMESVIVEPGVVRHLSGARRVIFGEPEGGVSERVARLREQLVAAGINAETPPDVRVEIWRKFVLVSASNALTALTRSPVGEILANPPGRRLVAQMMGEAVAVAAKLGVALPGYPEAGVQFLESLGPKLRSSMLKDVESGRLTEVDALNGYVVRRGEELGIDVSLNRMVAVALTLHNQRVAQRPAAAPVAAR